MPVCHPTTGSHMPAAVVLTHQLLGTCLLVCSVLVPGAVQWLVLRPRQQAAHGEAWWCVAKLKFLSVQMHCVACCWPECVYSMACQHPAGPAEHWCTQCV